MNNTQQTENSTQPQFWPEAVRTEPRQDKFPWKALLTGLLPGILAIVLLLIPFIWLRDQANQNIVYVNPNGQVNAIQANRENPQTIGQPPLQLNEATQKEVERTLPVLAWPEWSPDGRKLAATVGVNNNAQVVVFNTISKTTTVFTSPINDANKVVVPGNGWSPDSDQLALLETDDVNAYLSLVDLSQEEPVLLPVPVSFDAQGGLDWHPSGEQLLVTTLLDGSSSSTLHIVEADTGQARPFIPQDGQLFRTNAVWSPEGQFIAYIVPEPSQLQENGQYAGTLWVAKSDGTGARELVGEGLNMAPIWHEIDPNFIYFTRYITGTNNADYVLYKVNINGFTEPEIVGESYEAFLNYPFDQDRFWNVSKDDRSLSLNDTPTPSTNKFGWTPDSVIRAAIQQSIPTLGMPNWSPDGRFLATTSWQDGKIVPTVYNASLEGISNFSRVYDVMAVPASGWSNDSLAIAIVESDGSNTYLALATEPFDSSDTVHYKEFFLDGRASLNWHPLEPKLLVTAYTDENPIPSLYVVTPGAAPQPLKPDDGFSLHADAAWSPDGSQIAYIATDVYTSGQDILPGALWVADSNGGRARQLLSDAQLIAPMWNTDGTTITYIKVGGELGSFALYRIAVDGSTVPEYIGPANEQLARYPLDRNRFLQWSDDGRQLLFTGAQPMPPASYIANAPNIEAINQIRADIPFLGISGWSPDGTQYAGTILDEGDIRAAIYKSPSDTPILSSETTDWMVVPADGWSPDSIYLALLRYDGSAAKLAIMDTIQSSLIPVPFSLDTRAGLSWRPGTPQLMATSLDDGITPTLRIQNISDNSTSDFLPEDNQAVHADGVWSPDGRQVAYITQETITPTLEMDFLAGALWVADSDGQNARQLVPEGLNFAPIWDTPENRIIFTRYLTETDTFEMYKVSLEGNLSSDEDSDEALASYYGPGSPAFATFPFDRQSFLRWSPEGIRWLLPGGTQSLPFAYYRVDKDGVVSTLPTNCRTSAPYIANWTPNNRGVLVACPSGKMFLYWTDFQRSNKEYPDGLYPSWQP